MIKKIYLLFQLFLISFSVSFSQVLITGSVRDANTGAPIPYVNIGIADSEIGTISNVDGSFTVRIASNYLEKKLIFSAIGYTRISVPVLSLKKNSTNIISLSEKVTTLQNVTVTAKREKKESVWLGNGKKPLLLQGILDYDSATAGAAMALLIENDDPENIQFIEKATLHIARNTLPEFKVRLRFLEVDSTNNNLRGADIFNESIIVTSNIRKGNLTFDLSSYQYKLDLPCFYLMFEWILDDIDRWDISSRYSEFAKLNPEKVSIDTVEVDGEKVTVKRLGNFILGTFFSVTSKKTHLKRYKTYTRSHSFGEWGRESGTLSAEVLMSNEPPNINTSESTVLTKKKDESEQVLSLEDRLDKWGDNFLKNYDITGMQLSISSGNKLVFSKGFGYSDIEKRQTVNSSTQFRIASVSKPLTSAAVVKLASENIINLDGNVRDYVPSFPEKDYDITPRQLATHTGGIRDYYETSLDEIFVQKHYPTATDAIEIFKDDPLRYKPGQEFLYSSYGYTLLGAVIEGATKQSYLQYMYNNIWQPLGMYNTYGDVADSIMINKSKFYDHTGEEAKPYDLSYKYPSGGLLSTTDDLVKFGNALLHGSFLNTSTKNSLFEPSKVMGQSTNYGLGWYIGKDKNGRRVWYHAGELPSSGSIIILYPDDDIVVALLTNSPILTDAQTGLSIDIQEIGELLYSQL